MEKWKLGVIAAMIVALGGYGIYQQNAPAGPPASAAPKEYNTKMAGMIGKAPASWDIPQKYWFNTLAPITQANTKGKVTLLEFFSISCPHCQDAVPFMNSLYAKYHCRQGLGH
jgi:protein-disulfide isomerase